MGGLAAQDKRLKKDDRILEINCQDMSQGTQEQAAHIIQASVDKVSFVISRKNRPATPDIIRSTSKDCLSDPKGVGKSSKIGYPLQKCKEKNISVTKDPSESLGISVAGGFNSTRGDIPVYVTNIQPSGCLGRSKQIKKGDVLLQINGNSLLDLTHGDAVRVLKSCAESKMVTLKVIEGPETSDGIANFTPSWKFWLSMPLICHVVKTIKLKRTGIGTLGFSIVGGLDSSHGPSPVYVKSVVPNTPADKDGRIRSGDMLLSVNGLCLETVTHSQAVAALKNAKTSEVLLRVVSWPGTFV